MQNRFGMFVHWGLYAIPAVHEQVLARGGWNHDDYEALMHRFNPIKYDPEAWVTAAKAAGISRSAFYKYKDFVHEYNTRLSDSIMTVSVSLMDEPGMLASVLSAVSGSGANILTVHQNIPTDSVAPVSISMRTNQLNCTEEEMLVRLRELPGVLDAKFVSGH